MSTDIITKRTVDAPVALDATWGMKRQDRRKIDDQVLGVQQHIANNLINGLIATYFTLSRSSGSGAVGQAVCISPDDVDGQTVTIALASPIASAGGVILGFLLEACAPGADARIALSGILPSTVAGLGAGTAGIVYVNPATARLTRTPTQFAIGSVDSVGNVSLSASSASTGSGAGAAADIGTAASPGVLRGLIGTGSVPALHVGGFRKLGDSGGGSFYWDGASTDADNIGTCVRPTAIAAPDPGRWKRIYSGPLHLDWFGCYGDDSHDDTDAINAAAAIAAALGAELRGTVGKIYKVLGQLNFDNTRGLRLHGGGGFKFQDINSSVLKFYTSSTGPLISAKSTNGFQFFGWNCDYSNVAFPTVSYTYKTLADRDAATGFVGGDVGKWCYVTGAPALMTGSPNLTFAAAGRTITRSTGSWLTDLFQVGDVLVIRLSASNNITTTITNVTSSVLTVADALVNEGPTSGCNLFSNSNELGGDFYQLTSTTPTWSAARVPVDCIDTGHYHAGLGDEGGDTGNVRIVDCNFFGSTPNPYVKRAIRFAKTLTSSVEKCYFTHTQTGVGGHDADVDGSAHSTGGYANGISILGCVFRTRRAITNPTQGWHIMGGTTFEPFDASPYISCDNSSTVFGLCVTGCWLGDGLNVFTIDINHARGGFIGGNLIVGITAVRLTDTYGMAVVGNDLFSNNGVEFAGACKECAVTPNYFNGVTAQTVINPGGCANLIYQDIDSITFRPVTSFNIVGSLITGNACTVGSLGLSGGNGCTSSGIRSITFGGSCANTGAYCLNVGNTCGTSADYAQAFGLNSQSTAKYASCVGAGGLSSRIGQRTLGGGQTLFGVAGGAQAPDFVLSRKIATGSTLALQDADGNAQMALDVHRIYYLKCRLVVTDAHTTAPTKRYAITWCGLVQCVASTAVILSSSTSDEQDPDSIGPGGTNHVALSVSVATNVLSFNVANSTGLTLNAVAAVSWTESYSSV